MPHLDRRVALMVIFVVSIVSAGYYANILGYENSLGTQNTLTVKTGQSSEATDDVLMNLSFMGGGENLSWNSVQLSLGVGDIEYPCMIGGLSSIAHNNGTVFSKLNADGKTFTINIDTTGEEKQYFDLHAMSASNESSYSLSFLQTDIFLGKGRKGLAVNEEFGQISSDSIDVLNENEEQRLEWYSYDFSVHRIVPNSEVYIVEDRGVFFKIMFLNYYNSNDDPRHITLFAAPIENTNIPALTDESIIQVAPCLIVDNGDGVWGGEEMVSLQENGISICTNECSVTVIALYEEKRIVGADSIYQFN